MADWTPRVTVVVATRDRAETLAVALDSVLATGYRDLEVVVVDNAPSTDDTRVLVTFLPSSRVDLKAHGIDEEQAAELRARLTTFAEDWDSPEMDLYDDYDAARARLQMPYR